MHAWNWKDICRPKEEAGVGIRRVSDINKESRVRLTWRILSTGSVELLGCKLSVCLTGTYIKPQQPY